MFFAFRQLVFSAAGETNPGLIRDHNEDAFSLFDGGNFLMAVVADGVSCQGHGAVASELCCQVWHDAAEKAAGELVAEPGSIERFLRDTLKFANQQVVERDKTDGIMAETTVCVLCLAGQYAGIVHAGDSRVYRLRGRKMQLLTHDHTVAEKYYQEHGYFPTNQEKYSAMIYRAVGAHATIDADIRIEKVKKGDRFLLCSDGLYRQVDFNQIADILKKNATPRAAVDRLMRAGLLGGAEDNLTAAVVYAGMEKL